MNPKQESPFHLGAICEDAFQVPLSLFTLLHENLKGNLEIIALALLVTDHLVLSS